MAQVSVASTTGVAARTVYVQATGSLGVLPGMFPRSSTQVTLIESSGLACNTLDGLPKWQSSAAAAALVPRGGCAFERKARVSEELGYSAIIVMNGLEAMYNSTMDSLPPNSTLQAGQCNIDCNKGKGWVPLSQAQTIKQASYGYPCEGGGSSSAPGRADEACVLTGEVDEPRGLARVCRVADDFITMSGGAQNSSTSEVSIYAYFASLAGSAQLRAAVHEASTAGLLGPIASVGLRHVPAFDASGVVIWAVGVAVAAWAAWTSAGREREAIWQERQAAESEQGAVQGGKRGQGSGPMGDAAEEEVQLTWAQAGMMLLMVCAMLLGLYALVRLNVPIVYALIGVFALAGCGAVAQFYASPLLHMGAPGLTETVLEIPWLGAVTVNALLSTGLGVLCVGLWVGLRHHGWAFVLYDLVGAAIAASVLYRLRLPNLQLGAAIGAVFLLYDVFMVFVTPLIFGSSVMIDVATAGAGGEAAPGGVDRECYCRLHPEDGKVCGPTESMPILLAIPRFNTLLPGSALLGLGDIVLPGLLLALAARWDYVQWGSLGEGKYYLGGVVAYAIGLLAANAAVYGMQQGQPALLYLMPALLIQLCATAWAKGELQLLWSSPFVWEEEGGREQQQQRGAGGSGGPGASGLGLLGEEHKGQGGRSGLGGIRGEEQGEEGDLGAGAGGFYAAAPVGTAARRSSGGMGMGVESESLLGGSRSSAAAGPDVELGGGNAFGSGGGARSRRGSGRLYDRGALDGSVVGTAMSGGRQMDVSLGDEEGEEEDDDGDLAGGSGGFGIGSGGGRTLAGSRPYPRRTGVQ